MELCLYRAAEQLTSINPATSKYAFRKKQLPCKYNGFLLSTYSWGQFMATISKLQTPWVNINMGYFTQ